MYINFSSLYCNAYLLLQTYPRLFQKGFWTFRFEYACFTIKEHRFSSVHFILYLWFGDNFKLLLCRPWPLELMSPLMSLEAMNNQTATSAIFIAWHSRRLDIWEEMHMRLSVCPSVLYAFMLVYIFYEKEKPKMFYLCRQMTIVVSSVSKMYF